MEAASEVLLRELVAAYRPYLGRLATDHGIDEAVAVGAQWLEQQLTAELSQPFVAQRRTPLQIFQEAMRFPNEALQAIGVAVPERPGRLEADTYDIAPATSRDLGEAAWTAHLAWGAAKTTAHRTVCWFGRDLADRSRIEGAVAAAGGELSAVPQSLHACSRVIVDLQFSGGGEAAAAGVDLGLPVIVYGPHVQREALDAAAAAGAQSFPRSVFFSRLDSLVATYPDEPERVED